ncbi:MAG TPA: hypothetical protein VEU97_03495 [Ktedonobacteraceae bacterium]|nr:hypothetical protein [Ktedonobacteraceae bacterium]
MNNQTTVVHTKDIIVELQAERRRKERFLFLVVCSIFVFFTPLVVLAAVNLWLSLLLSIAAVIIIGAVIARWPQAGFFIMSGCVVLIDQATLPVPVFTDKLYVYYWPPYLEGLIERPIGFLFLFILLVIIYHHISKREPLLGGGALIVPFLLFLLCVVGGAVYGYLTGGSLKIIVVELRPFVYLFEAYLIAYNLVTHKSYIRIFFWFVIVAAGVKALQGIYIYLKLHGQLGYHTLMSHEESFFFIGLLLLVVLLSLHYRYKPQLYAALCVLPLVVFTLVVNDRRADYFALIAGWGTAWMLMFVIEPRRRKALVIILLVSSVLVSGYTLLFASSTSGFAAPAHAIVAVISPSRNDARDADSNLYRMVENGDLRYTISHNSFWLGLGFGKPYPQPVPLVNIYPAISSDDLYYNYVPHNNIYWVWMRLGAIGFLAFWYLIGSIIVRGSLIARQLRDRGLQMVAIYAVCMTVMEIIVAYADYQLFTYRNVIYIGLLAGVLMKLPELDKEKEDL